MNYMYFAKVETFLKSENDFKDRVNKKNHQFKIQK